MEAGGSGAVKRRSLGTWVCFSYGRKKRHLLNRLGGSSGGENAINQYLYILISYHLCLLRVSR